MNVIENKHVSNNPCSQEKATNYSPVIITNISDFSCVRLACCMRDYRNLHIYCQINATEKVSFNLYSI